MSSKFFKGAPELLEKKFMRSEVLASALSHSFGLHRQDKVLEAVLQGQVASDHS